MLPQGSGAPAAALKTKKVRPTRIMGFVVLEGVLVKAGGNSSAAQEQSGFQLRTRRSPGSSPLEGAVELCVASRLFLVAGKVSRGWRGLRNC